MPRNRQLLRLVHLARTSPKNTAQADPIQPRRRALRRLALPAAAAALLLIVTQVVLAAVPPENVGFTISPTTTPTRGQSVTFEASAATNPDTGGTITSYSWNFGDGTSGSGQSATHTYANSVPAGQKTVTLTVTDSENETTTASQSLQLRNLPPTAGTVSCLPTNPPPAPNDPITCTNNGAGDQEGAISRAWDIDGDGFDDGGDQSETFFFADPGAHTIRVRITDSDQGTAIAQQQVTVANSPPTATITEVTPLPPQNGNVPYVGQKVHFVGSGVDPNGDNLNYTWSFGQGESTAVPGKSVDYDFKSHGSKTVTLTVSDGDQSGTATTQMTINELPVARAGVLNSAREAGQRNDVPLVGQTFALTAGPIPALPPAPASLGATDADGANGKPAVYRWDLDNNQTFGDATGESIPFGPFNTPGPRTVGLEVVDSRQATHRTTLTFNVNSEPTPQFSIEPLKPIVGERVTFTSNSFDTQDNTGQLTYNWDLDDDGTFGEVGSATQVEERGQSVSRSFPTANISPGHRVRLRVTDTGGISRVATRMVTVQNTKPTGRFTWSPKSPLPSERVTFNGSPSVATAGKQILSYEWDFDYDPTKDQFDRDAAGVTPTHSFATAGTKTVALRVTETDGGVDIVRNDEPLVVNAPPRAGFHVAPGEAFVGDGVTLSSTSVDPDGRLERQDWDLDGDGQFDDANAQVVSANFVNPGLHRLALRVTDLRGATATATGQVMIRTRPIPPTPLLTGVLVELRAAVYAKFTKVRGLLVRAPKGAKIAVRCKGKGCPKVVTKVSKGSKKLRFKKLQRNFKPGRKLIVTVTKKGFIGKQTSWTIRRRKAPLRKDLCMNPGVKKASACPGG
jgi:hypothetical protein